MKHPSLPKSLFRGRRLAGLGAVSLLLASYVGWAAGKAAPDKSKPAEPAKTEAATGGKELPAAKPDTVRIFIQTVPPRKATVRWGNKTLGVIPTPNALVVERPRDSGPLDLVIRAVGFLPVHTRAYTFSDLRVSVKLTPPSEKSKLFGYREEPAPNPDAGVPPEPPPGAAPPASQP
jgi:hypothetical protein